jgi:polar amino acid transport system substrate-binding protein
VPVSIDSRYDELQLKLFEEGFQNCKPVRVQSNEFLEAMIGDFIREIISCMSILWIFNISNNSSIDYNEKGKIYTSGQASPAGAAELLFKQNPFRNHKTSGDCLHKKQRIGILLTSGGNLIMKKIAFFAFSAAVVLLSAVTGLSSCQKKTAVSNSEPAAPPKVEAVAAIQTIKPGVLLVGMEIGYPPMEYLDIDGKTPLGFDVDMSKIIAERLGLRAEFVDTAWDGIFAGVDTGKYDCIISAVTVTPERIANYNFTKPYIGNAQALVQVKNAKVPVKSPSELTGLEVAYQGETTTDIYMAKLAADGLEFIPREYDKVLNCFDELRIGRVDAVVCDSLVAFDYIAVEDSPFEIVWQGDADETFAICFKKGNDALTAAVDQIMDSLFADGTMLKLSQDIFKMDMVSSARQ